MCVCVWNAGEGSESTGMGVRNDLIDGLKEDGGGGLRVV